jgi:hypothetical protein
MTDEQIALARRAVACKGWKWMPGMAIGCMIFTSTHGLVVVPHGRVLAMRDDDGMQMVSASEYPYDNEGVPEYLWADLTHIPDLTDPATLGCLLALVREHHKEPRLAVVPNGKGWSVSRVWLRSPHDRVAGVHTLEAEALVAALEATP